MQEIKKIKNYNYVIKLRKEFDKKIISNREEEIRKQNSFYNRFKRFLFKKKENKE